VRGPGARSDERARVETTTRHASAAPVRLGSIKVRRVRRRLEGTGPFDPGALVAARSRSPRSRLDPVALTRSTSALALRSTLASVSARRRDPEASAVSKMRFFLAMGQNGPYSETSFV